jgi:hypothetical protein
MLVKILIAWCLVAATVIIHAAGLAIVLGRLLRSTTPLDTRTWSAARRVIAVAWWLIVIHSVEIVLWGLFYWRQGCMPDAASSFYFSGVTYTTTGYGDFVLPKEWRMFGPIEALTGILMCGLSTAGFFALLNRIHSAREKHHQT